MVYHVSLKGVGFYVDLINGEIQHIYQDAEKSQPVKITMFDDDELESMKTQAIQKKKKDNE